MYATPRQSQKAVYKEIIEFDCALYSYIYTYVIRLINCQSLELRLQLITFNPHVWIYNCMHEHSSV